MRTYSNKVCLLGDFAVGKTSLVRRFIYDIFEDVYISTIGVKVSRKKIYIADAYKPVTLTMMLWDISSDEQFIQIRNNYLRGATGAILVCDLTRPETLQTIRSYFTHLLTMNPDIKAIITANKNDLIYNPETSRQIESMSVEFNLPAIFTSAKTGDQVETLFYTLARLMIP